MANLLATQTEALAVLSATMRDWKFGHTADELDGLTDMLGEASLLENKIQAHDEIVMVAYCLRVIEAFLRDSNCAAQANMLREIHGHLLSVADSTVDEEEIDYGHDV